MIKRKQIWIDWLQSNTPEDHIPEVLSRDGSSLDTHSKDILRLGVLRILRPDRFITGANALIEKAVDKELLQDTEVNLEEVIIQETDPQEPVLLMTTEGFDPTVTVNELAKKCNADLSSYAMGSSKVRETAREQLQKAMRQGSWLILRNVHLDSTFMMELEKTINSRNVSPHDNFRLLLSCEVSPSVPASILRASHKVMFEPPAGIKASLERS